MLRTPLPAALNHHWIIFRSPKVAVLTRRMSSKTNRRYRSDIGITFRACACCVTMRKYSEIVIIFGLEAILGVWLVHFKTKTTSYSHLYRKRGTWAMLRSGLRDKCCAIYTIDVRLSDCRHWLRWLQEIGQQTIRVLCIVRTSLQLSPNKIKFAFDLKKTLSSSSSIDSASRNATE